MRWRPTGFVVRAGAREPRWSAAQRDTALGEPEYFKPARSVYTRYVMEVYRAISGFAEGQGHRDVRRGQGDAP